jgi:iron complex transport system permease protein
LAQVRPSLLFPVLVILSLLAGLFALVSGSADISTAEIWQALAGNAADNSRSVIMDLRLPRALTAFGVGGLLAVAGVLMQVLLRNPLAEPYILGSSGGAAVAALLAMMLGLGATLVDLSAFAGARKAPETGHRRVSCSLASCLHRDSVPRRPCCLP